MCNATLLQGFYATTYSLELFRNISAISHRVSSKLLVHVKCLY